MAAAGIVDQEIVDEVLQQPYFVHDIPKTTGRETFGDNLSEELCQRMLAKGPSPEDCVATITRITAKSLADGYKRWGPPGGIDEIYLGGGGPTSQTLISICENSSERPRFSSWMLSMSLVEAERP